MTSRFLNFNGIFKLFFPTEAEATLSKSENAEYSTQDLTDTDIALEATDSTTLALQNTTESEEFLINDFVTPFGEIMLTTPINLEIPSALNDNDEINNTETQDREEASRSKLFTTLLNLEEDYNMSFDKMAKIYLAENTENNVEKKRRKGRQQGMDVFADLEDDLVESELVKQDVKYKSLGIEPLALVMSPDGRARTPVRGELTILFIRFLLLLLFTDRISDLGTRKSVHLKHVRFQLESNSLITSLKFCSIKC